MGRFSSLSCRLTTSQRPSFYISKCHVPKLIAVVLVIQLFQRLVEDLSPHPGRTTAATPAPTIKFVQFPPILGCSRRHRTSNNSRNCIKRALRRLRIDLAQQIYKQKVVYLFKNKRALSSKRRCHPRFFCASAATSSSSVVVRLAQESFLKEYYRTGTNIVHSTNSFKKKQNNFHSNWTRCHLLRYKFWQRARAVGYVIHPNSTVTSRLCCHNPPCRAHR